MNSRKNEMMLIMDGLESGCQEALRAPQKNMKEYIHHTSSHLKFNHCGKGEITNES